MKWEKAKGGFIGLVLLWGMPTAFGGIIEDAAQNIEQYRKGNAMVTLRTSEGNLLNGAQVTVNQTLHDFYFGNIIRPRHFPDATYKSRLKEMFNFVTSLEFNWGQYEPDEGQSLLAERMEMVDWCLANDINLFGHMLVWTKKYGTYPKAGLPEWLWNYDRATQYSLLENRVKREMRDFKGKLEIWDVINEPVNVRIWGDWEKANNYKDTIDNIYPYVKDSLNWARSQNSQAILMINEYNVITNSRVRNRYKRLIQKLQDNNVPLDALGIQAHEPRYTWYSPSQLLTAYDELGSFGLPLLITEFTYSSDSTKDIKGGYRSGKWNQNLQAEAGEEFYRVTFGHPDVFGIIWFGMSDDDVWLSKGAVLDENWQPKKVWNMLKNLIHQEWHTAEAGMSSGSGTFSFHGFYGKYDVTVEIGGETFNYTAYLHKGQVNDWNFTVPVDAFPLAPPSLQVK